MGAISQTTLPNLFFEWHFFNQDTKVCPEGPINNIPALVQVMAWRRPGDKPLSEPMKVQFTDAYMRRSLKLITGECHKNSLPISQLWFR